MALPVLLTPGESIIAYMRIAFPLLLALSIPILWRLRNVPALDDQQAERMLWCIVAGFVILSLLLCSIMTANYRATTIDTGVVLNASHNTGDGLFFYNEFEGGSRFKVHNSSMTLLLWLLHQFLPGLWPIIILVIVCLAASALVVYQIARTWLDPLAGVLLATAYLLNPVIIAQALPEFHPMDLAPLPVALMLYFFIKKRLNGFLLCLFVAVSIKESMPLICATMAIAGVACRRNWQWVVWPIAISIGWGLFSFSMVLPHFNEAGQARIVHKLFGQETLSGALAYMLSHPSEVLAQIGLKQSGHAYLLLLSWGLVPMLLTPWTLLALPHVAMLMLIDNDFTLRVWDASALGPIMALAAASGLPRLKALWDRRVGTPPERLLVQTAALIIALALATGPVWLRAEDLRPRKNRQAIDNGVALVPDDVSLTTNSCLTPYTYEREVLRPAPYWPVHEQPYSEYVLLLWDDEFKQMATQLQDDDGQERVEEWDAFVADLDAGKQPYGYELVWSEDDVYVARHASARR
jgi:hypothetical protein